MTDLQPLILPEPVPADLTDVGPVVGVHAGVGAQRRGVEEALVALRALVGANALVNELMALQAAGVGEDRGALRAFVGLLPCEQDDTHSPMKPTSPHHHWGFLVVFFYMYCYHWYQYQY